MSTGDESRATEATSRPWLFGAAGLLLAAYWATGALRASVLPSYASSPEQIIGTALMLILTPAYLVAAHALGRRRSLDLVEQLRGEITRGLRWWRRATWHIGTER